MIYFLYEKLSGRIYSATTFLPTDLSNLYGVIPTELPINSASKYYVSSNELVLLPEPPNQYSVFNYTTKQWEDTRTDESQWVVVREERNQKLQASDWTQLADIPSETKSLWEPYRQALRDVTLQPDPFNITWPTPP